MRETVAKTWRELENLLQKHKDRYNIAEIRHASAQAQKYHEGQKRKTGEPYIIHPLKTAITVAGFQIDTPTVEAALLHDVVEDTDCNLDQIEQGFGEEVAFLVNGVTKLGHIKYRGVEAEIENLRKMTLAMSEDIRVILIKLADRLDNMRTLDALSPEKQRRIALETLDLYSPIAHRLGIGEIAGDLADLAFPYVHPKEYRWLMENVRERYEERKLYIETLVPTLTAALAKSGITPLSLHSRAKHYYSLYKKLLQKDMNLEAIYDLVALRLIVESVEDCYAALGTVHALWKPLPDRIKDYIALPKPNGYRSLHTTVFGPNGKVLEVQIRTQEMHEESERGVAAHWHYSEQKRTAKQSQLVPKEFAWVNQLQKWQEENRISDEFLESLKIDFFKDRIFVITPRGDVIDLPDGSTPVDFAYHIHTDVGNQCAGARVNGKIAPLNYRLTSGEIVEILTQKNKLPSEQWLEFVKTSFAKNKIRETLRKKSGTLASASKIIPAEIHFLIRAKNRIGLIQDLSKIFSSAKINISEFATKEQGAYSFITVACKITDAHKIAAISMRLRAIKGVTEVSAKAGR